MARLYITIFVAALPGLFALSLPNSGDPCALYVDASAPQPLLATGSLSSPFVTISAAQAALRARPSLRAPSGPTRVCIRDGVYREALTFTYQDSGTSPDAPVIYSAAPGATNVSLSGALPLAFSPLPAGDAARAWLSPTAAAAVVVADAAAVPASALVWPPRRGWGPYGGCLMPPGELISAEGVIQATARWPNAADASQGTASGFALTGWHAPSDGVSNASVWVPADAPWLAYRAPAPFLGGLQVHGFWSYEWADGYVSPRGVEGRWEDLVQVSLPDLPNLGPASLFSTSIGRARYYVTNALEALDAPGEYYVDTTAARVYWWPPPGASPTAGSLSVNGTLVSFAGAHDVWLSGITLEGTRSHGVQLTSARGIVLDSLTIRNVGQDAVNAVGSNGTLVSRALIHDAGCGGVRFSGGGDRTSLTPSGNALLDSEVTRVARTCFTYNPAVELDTGAVAAHNELHDMPHAAVSLDGNDVQLVGNLIHHVSRITFDNAAVYWYPTDWSKRGTVIRYNFFYLNAQDATTCNLRTSCNRDAIYPDNGSAGVLIESNIIYHPRPASTNVPCENCAPLDAMVSYAVFEDGTREAVKRNNIIVLNDVQGGPPGSNVSFNGGAGLAWDTAQQGNASAYIAKLHAVGWNSGIYAARYPALAALHDFWPAGGVAACALDPACGAAPFGFELTTNVVVGAAATLTPPPPALDNPAFFNISNNLHTDDPGWASADPRGELSFQLRADSPAYAMGFVRIPMECFGVGKRCPGEEDWGAQARLVLRAAGR